MCVIVSPCAARWCVPPGAGPAAIHIEVFNGPNLPRAASAKPLLTYTGWFAMQVCVRAPQLTTQSAALNSAWVNHHGMMMAALRIHMFNMRLLS